MLKERGNKRTVRVGQEGIRATSQPVASAPVSAFKTAKNARLPPGSLVVIDRTGNGSFESPWELSDSSDEELSEAEPTAGTDVGTDSSVVTVNVRQNLTRLCQD